MSCNDISNWRAFPFLLLLAPLLLSGCAAPLPRQEMATEAPAQFHLQGRIAVRHGTEGFSGNLDWQHDARSDRILLLSPLGQTVARIERQEEGVMLETSDMRHVAQDAAELTERVLGWSLPLEGMQYWVTGHAAPSGKPEIARDADLNLARLKQQEWEIEYRDYRREGRYLLPTRMVMRQAALELRLVVDEWNLP